MTSKSQYQNLFSDSWWGSRCSKKYINSVLTHVKCHTRSQNISFHREPIRGSNAMLGANQTWSWCHGWEAGRRSYHLIHLMPVLPGSGSEDSDTDYRYKYMTLPEDQTGKVENGQDYFLGKISTFLISPRFEVYLKVWHSGRICTLKFGYFSQHTKGRLQKKHTSYN